MSFSRFASASKEEKENLNDAKDSANTKKAVIHAVKTLRDYCISKNQSAEFEKLSITDLDHLLEGFYIDLRTKEGTLYKASSFTLMRFGVNKHLNKVLKYDIPNDRQFAQSNMMYHSVCTKLKKEGLALKIHKVPISDVDMKQLYTCGIFDTGTPTGLLRKVFFEVMFHLCRRGRQNLREMTHDSLKIVRDEDGFEFVCMAKDELTKNHRKADDASSQARMYALPGNCPPLFFKNKK